MNQQFRNIFILLLSISFACLISACSNSDGVDNARWEATIVSQNSEESSNFSSLKLDYLPLNDTEYPYAGIPRIVIETENHREIKDRETEIPAKLQIWGEKAPESDIMDLSIRGRGNTTWNYPKKPYAIKFEKKQAFLGMPEAKKWVMLANYRDRTLIRNAVAFELARKTTLAWTPHGKFADVFLNGKFLGNYYICEKIEVKKNRLELSDKGFLLEIDRRFDGEYKFRTTEKNLPINIKYPKNPSKQQINDIKKYIDSLEKSIYGNYKDSSDYDIFFDLKSFAEHWIIQELTQNIEPTYPYSVYVYKDINTSLYAGPIWDFDWQTFSPKVNGLITKHALWNKALLRHNKYCEIVKEQWNLSRQRFKQINKTIDSLANYTKKSNEQNFLKWPIQIAILDTNWLAGDETLSFYTSIDMMKRTIENRIVELDSLFNSL